MLNDNVGEMPIDIFGDYISDTLGEEWTWEYLVIAINGNNFFSYWMFGHGYCVENYGYGIGYGGLFASGDSEGLRQGHGIGNYFNMSFGNGFNDGR